MRTLCLDTNHSLTVAAQKPLPSRDRKGAVAELLPLCLILILPISMSAQQRTQARSMVISRNGIVATSQTLASQAGAMVLARGGSAVDAAIAANAVLGVVE